MARKWKSGDVVTATVNGRENVRLVAGWSKYDPQLRWCELSPRWADGDDEECWFFPSQVTDARPLVVIDPEDREQVERLASLYNSAAVQSVGTEPLRAALREFADPTPPEPPKPEPFKPGDVVRHRHSGSVWTIAEDGRMVSHRDGRVYDHGAAWFANSVTPEHYERLSVDEGEA